MGKHSIEYEKKTRLKSQKRPIIKNGVQNQEKPKNNKKKRRIFKFFRNIILFFIVLAVIIAGIGTAFIKSKYGQLKLENIDKDAIGISSYVDRNIEKTGYRNIALFGIDSRTDDYGVGNRSDCIIIASINKKTKEVKLTSVFRDTYIDVENKGNTKLDKITHAYAYGGAENTIKSLNQAMDLNISEYVTANFDAVIDAVDALGGIEITLDKEEVNNINWIIDENNEVSGHSSSHIKKAGTYNLDGVQALAYARIRSTAGGDYKRAERMRTVINKMMEKTKELSISELNDLINVVLPHIRTNIHEINLLLLAPTLLKANVEASVGWPYETKGDVINGVWYGVPCTLESNVKRFHVETFGEENYEPSQRVKDMSNRIIKKTGYKSN